jgi:hypothetical protein
MVCEKFDNLFLEELYDELDEVTSAAVKRHASGCARCGPILDGLRATQRRARLPAFEVPADLEDRILASVSEAQRATPPAPQEPAALAAPLSGSSRGSRALSWAGSWAMRPQTAMAAVFLLMVGTSAFVLRSRHSSERAAAVSVTEQGAPAGPSEPADDHESLDSKAAAAAHGPNVPPAAAPPVAANPVASAAGGIVAPNDPAGSAGLVDDVTGGRARGSKDEQAVGSTLSGKDKQSTKEEAAEKKAPSGPALEIANAAPPAGAPDGDYAPRSQAVARPTNPSGGAQEQQDGFSAGMAAYRARNFLEATRSFDLAARSGDQNAALWAAKAVKEDGGCGAATPRFEGVAQKAGGSWIGSEAQLEAARCQMAGGQLDAARDKLARLSLVPSHAVVAQQLLRELDQVASRRAKGAGVPGGGGVARPAPARVPSKPSATTSGDTAKDVRQ